MGFMPDSSPSSLFRQQVRGEGEIWPYLHRKLGPFCLGMTSHRGLITCRDTGLYNRDTLHHLASGARDFFAHETQLGQVSWKIYDSDAPAQLAQIATDLEFHLRPGPEYLLAGQPQELLPWAGHHPLAGNVVVRPLRATDLDFDALVAELSVLFLEVFARPTPVSALRRSILNLASHGEVFIALAPRASNPHRFQLVGSGRVEFPRPGRFAALSSAGVHPLWRHRGIYRLLLEARAQWALEQGASYLYSRCIPATREILQRAGFRQFDVAHTYEWTRPES